MAYKYCKNCGHNMPCPTLRQVLLDGTQTCTRCHTPEYLFQLQGFEMLVEDWENTHHFDKDAQREIRNDERSHTLYLTGDDDAPDSTKDRDGAVVLALCRTCGLAEQELIDTPYCSGKAEP